MKQFMETAVTVLEIVVFLTVTAVLGLAWYTIHETITILEQTPLGQMILN